MYVICFRISIAQLVDDRMLSRQCDERYTIRRIRARRIHGKFLTDRRYLDIELESLAAPYPVALHGLYALRPALEPIKIFEQDICIVSDLQEPLRKVFLMHF